MDILLYELHNGLARERLVRLRGTRWDKHDIGGAQMRKQLKI